MLQMLLPETIVLKVLHSLLQLVICSINLYQKLSTLLQKSNTLFCIGKKRPGMSETINNGFIMRYIEEKCN